MNASVRVLSAVTMMVAWAGVGALAGDTQPDPKELMTKVDAATKAVDAVQYEVTGEATGSAASRYSKFEGSYAFEGVSDAGFGFSPKRYRIELRAEGAAGAAALHATGATDGNEYFLLDHSAKKAYADLDPKVLGTAGRLMFAGMMVEFVHPEPFSDEVNAGKLEITGSKDVHGVDCWEVQVTYAQPQAPLATWYIGKKDNLPRGRIDKGKGRDGAEYTTSKMLKNVVANPKFEDTFFKLAVPEGYAKVDDFAP